MRDSRASSDEEMLERLEQAEQLKLAGKHREALNILEELLIDDPGNVPALEEIADNELNLGRKGRARAAAMQAIKLDKRSYTALYILGFLACREEKWEEAETYLRTANQEHPNNPEILRCLGWVLFCSDKRTQGIVTLERALNLDTESALTLCDLGVAYLKLQNLPKARTLFSQALDIDPENERAHECVQIIQRLEQHSLKSSPSKQTR